MSTWPGWRCPGQLFDKVFAINVHLFWVRPADAELLRIKELLRRSGVLHLVYETPGEEKAGQVAKAVTAALANHGFTAAVTTAGPPSLICITARLPHDNDKTAPRQRAVS